MKIFKVRQDKNGYTRKKEIDPKKFDSIEFQFSDGVYISVSPFSSCTVGELDKQAITIESNAPRDQSCQLIIEPESIRSITISVKGVNDGGRR